MQVIDDVMSLRERFCGGDDIIKHRRDFDWLLEAVTKVHYSIVIAGNKIFSQVLYKNFAGKTVQN